jgi:hypothetical protein
MTLHAVTTFPAKAHLRHYQLPQPPIEPPPVTAIRGPLIRIHRWGRPCTFHSCLPSRGQQCRRGARGLRDANVAGHSGPCPPG